MPYFNIIESIIVIIADATEDSGHHLNLQVSVIKFFAGGYRILTAF